MLFRRKKMEHIERGRFYRRVIEGETPELGYFWRHSQVRAWAKAGHEHTGKQVSVYTGKGAEEICVAFFPQ